jgi:cytochrome P450
MRSFDPAVLRSDHYRFAPEPVWQQMREDHPIVRDSTDPRGEVWWLTRYADVAAVFADHETYSAATYEDRTGAVLGPTLISRDDHGHVLRRSIVAPDFVGKRLASSFDLITHCANTLIDRFADHGGFDLVAQFSKRLPVDVIAAMLGMTGDGDLFRQWVSDMIMGLAPVDHLRAAGKEAHGAFCRHIEPALRGVDDTTRGDHRVRTRPTGSRHRLPAVGRTAWPATSDRVAARATHRRPIVPSRAVAADDILTRRRRIRPQRTGTTCETVPSS